MSRNFDWAHFTPGHGFSILASITLTIALLSSLAPTLAADDDVVVLPVEFFFGRWAQGVVVQGSGSWDKRHGPLWQIGGGYTSDQLNISVHGITGYGNPLDFPGSIDSANVTAMYRPSGAWQFGVGRLQYGRRRQEPTVFIDNYFAESSLRAVSLVSTSSNQEVVVQSAAFAKYSYFHGTLAGYKQFLWSTSFDFDAVDAEERVQYPMTYPYLEGSSKSASLKSRAAYGFSSRIHLAAVVQIERSSVNQEWVASDAVPILGTETDSRIWQTELSSEIIAKVHPNVFGRVFISQDFDRMTTDVTYFGSAVLPPPESEEFPTKGVNSVAGLSLSYLGQGAFQPTALLDDYQDFYHHLLFPNQQLINLAITYESRPRRDGPRDYLVRTVLDLARGLPFGLEVGGAVDYSWWKRWSIRPGGSGRPVPPPQENFYESLNWRTGIRWRSYRYVEGQGPGWRNDMPADIAFGPMLAPYQVYLAVTYQSPNFTTTGVDPDRGIFSFDDLSARQIHHLGLHAELGITVRCNVLADVDWTIDARDYPWFPTPNSGITDFGIRIRPWGNIIFAGTVKQVHRGDDSEPADLSVRVGGIF